MIQIQSYYLFHLNKTPNIFAMKHHCFEVSSDMNVLQVIRYESTYHLLSERCIGGHFLRLLLHYGFSPFGYVTNWQL